METLGEMQQCFGTESQTTVCGQQTRKAEEAGPSLLLMGFRNREGKGLSVME